MWLDSKAVNCPQKWGNFMATIGCAALLAALSQTTGLAAVAMTSVAGAANVKQFAATRTATDALAKNDPRFDHKSSSDGSLDKWPRVVTGYSPLVVKPLFQEGCHDRASVA